MAKNQNQKKYKKSGKVSSKEIGDQLVLSLQGMEIGKKKEFATISKYRPYFVLAHQQLPAH